MSNLREAAQQALEALKCLVETHEMGNTIRADIVDAEEAITALKAALEQTVQEPLSDEELDRLWREPMSADWEHREYARAVEAAHGIKENT
jgi:hypothetical protein